MNILAVFCLLCASGTGQVGTRHVGTGHAMKKGRSLFEDFFSNWHRLNPLTFQGEWTSRNEYTYEEENSFVKYNVEKKEKTILLDKNTYEMFNLTHVSVSADGKWIAIQHNKHSMYRHSSICRYTLIQAETGTHYQLADSGRIQLLVWDPVGSSLVFVKDNNVFYQTEDDRLKNMYKRITNSTSDVFNGIADWVYEEEVLGNSKALWFSPNGTKLVFATMNDTYVRNVTFWKYGDPGSLSSQYGQQVVIKYPKVGSRNPVAYLNVVDLKSEDLKPEKIKAPEDLVTSDNILVHVSWADENHFSMTWLERLQTKGNTLLCNVKDLSSCKLMYSYHEPNGWLKIVEPIWVNSTAFLTVLPQDQGGDLGNYDQLSLVEGGASVPLTAGLSVVTEIKCYDKQNGLVYFRSTLNGDSAKNGIYKLDVNKPERKECFSCRVKEDCIYGDAVFSNDCSYLVHTCSGPKIPQFHVFSKEGTLVQQISNNSELAEVMEKILLPTKLDFSVPVPGNFTARVRLHLPPNLDKSGRTKYPVMVHVYSGPDTNIIKDKWVAPGFNEYLVTKRNVIMATLDGRGSGLRGDKLKFAMYHKLGGPEIEDILIVGRYLQEHFPFVDPLRTGIWGWSYGGYATAMTLAKDSSNIFRCGISVAPVTNWIYYDSVYTERYMGLPTNDSNLAGYQAADVTTKVDNFRNKLFYVIHGTADDNVHFQQSMMLSRALQLADIMFFQQSYQDEAHGLIGIRRHLYHTMDEFWTRCFHLDSSDHHDPGLLTDFSIEYSGSAE